jgi:hypothetical protein
MNFLSIQVRVDAGGTLVADTRAANKETILVGLLVTRPKCTTLSPVGNAIEARRDKRCDQWSLRNRLGQVRIDKVFLLAGL